MGSADDLQHLLASVISVSLAYGMEISGLKTQTMCMSKEHEALSIKPYGNGLEKSQNLHTWVPAWHKTTQAMPMTVQELPRH